MSYELPNRIPAGIRRPLPNEAPQFPRVTPPTPLDFLDRLQMMAWDMSENIIWRWQTTREFHSYGAFAPQVIYQLESIGLRPAGRMRIHGFTNLPEVPREPGTFYLSERVNGSRSWSRDFLVSFSGHPRDRDHLEDFLDYRETRCIHFNGSERHTMYPGRMAVERLAHEQISGASAAQLAAHREGSRNLVARTQTSGATAAQLAAPRLASEAAVRRLPSRSSAARRQGSGGSAARRQGPGGSAARRQGPGGSAARSRPSGGSAARPSDQRFAQEFGHLADGVERRDFAYEFRHLAVAVERPEAETEISRTTRMNLGTRDHPFAILDSSEDET